MSAALRTAETAFSHQSKHVFRFTVPTRTNTCNMCPVKAPAPGKGLGPRSGLCQQRRSCCGPGDISAEASDCI